MFLTECILSKKWYLLSPIDLAGSKLSRFTGQDRDDILDLAKSGLINAESLKARAENSLVDYIANIINAQNSIVMIFSVSASIDTSKDCYALTDLPA